MPIVHGADDALGLSGLGEIELVVDGRNDHIETGQDLVRQVEAAVNQDVDLNTLEHHEAIELFVEAVDLVNLPRQPRCRAAAAMSAIGAVPSLQSE